MLHTLAQLLRMYPQHSRFSPRSAPKLQLKLSRLRGFPVKFPSCTCSERVQLISVVHHIADGIYLMISTQDVIKVAEMMADLTLSLTSLAIGVMYDEHYCADEHYCYVSPSIREGIDAGYSGWRHLEKSSFNPGLCG